MARVNLITGSWDGKVGQLVGAKWKDKKTIRAYVIPKDTKNDKQLQNRRRLTEAAQYISLFHDKIKPLTPLNVRGMTLINSIIKASPFLFKDDTFIPEHLIFSKGRLPPIHSVQQDYAAGNMILYIEKGLELNLSPKAKIVYAIYNTETEIAEVDAIPYTDDTIYFHENFSDVFIIGSIAIVHLWIIDYQGQTLIASNSKAFVISGP